jgi:hypothetical protein
MIHQNGSKNKIGKSQLFISTNKQNVPTKGTMFDEERRDPLEERGRKAGVRTRRIEAT